MSSFFAGSPKDRQCQKGRAIIKHIYDYQCVKENLFLPPLYFLEKRSSVPYKNPLSLKDTRLEAISHLLEQLVSYKIHHTIPIPILFLSYSNLIQIFFLYIEVFFGFKTKYLCSYCTAATALNEE